MYMYIGMYVYLYIIYIYIYYTYIYRKIYVYPRVFEAKIEQMPELQYANNRVCAVWGLALFPVFLTGWDLKINSS